MAVPASCRWLEPKARMDDACRVYNDRSEDGAGGRRWAALRDKSVPAVWQQASTSWQRAVQPLMALMGRDRYPAAGLQEIARFVRHARTHLLEKDAAACREVFGAAPTAATKDAVLVEYLGSRLPRIFVLLLWPPPG